ncbi:MAG: ComEC/Rec2 family competence protein [Paludibacteraceae bacterium]|nr:ComEC/Rec2 family competence protein [Paludibacteraceae bacterium]
MVTWLRNNPFFVLLVPLVLWIAVCKVCRLPFADGRQVPVEVQRQDTARRPYRVVLTSLPAEKPETWRCQASLLPDGYTFPVYLQKDSLRQRPNRGDTLLIFANLNGGYVSRWDWSLLSPDTRPWYRSALGWQQHLVQRYAQRGISGRELATLSALTLGCRDLLDKDITNSFSAAGAMHVLAVSGLHTGVLTTVLVCLITLFGLNKPMYGNIRKKVRQNGAIMLLLIMYAFITGASPSVVRSVIMACLFLLARLTRRHGQIMNVIFASAFLMLFFVPSDLFTVSFQLSYAAVIAIVLFCDGWENIWQEVVFYRNNFRYKAMHCLYGLIGVSVAAQIGTIPFTLHYFGQISNYFLLTNLLVIPLAFVMMVGAVAFFTLGWWSPIGKLIALGLNGVTWLLDESVSRIESLPLAVTEVSLPPSVFPVLCVASLSLLIAWNRVSKVHDCW